MQIKELVLYGFNGQARHLSFELGKVNIITGKSKSGKSAVGDIINYCLGGSSCDIADGVIRENVSWYGLLLQFESERVFVARQNPPSGQQSTGSCYIEIGEKIEVPEKCNFISNINVDGVEESLSKRLGISENLNIPPDGQSRAPLAANIRHALYYCFQNQDEIAAKTFLFHKQAEDFITQAIKDTLPYFLGIVNEESLTLENEKSILKRKLVVEKRRLEEIRMLQGGGLQRAASLISEAKQVGLLNETIEVNYDNYTSILKILKSVGEWVPINTETVGMDRLSILQSELIKLEDELVQLSQDINNAKIFTGETNGFVNEVEHQKIRLSSIGLFEKLDFITDHCPLCSNQLETPLPNINMIRDAIKNLDESIQNVTREKPKLRKYIDSLESERERIRENITQIKSEIDGIYTQNQDAIMLKDLNSRCAKVIGRISLWLESVEQHDDNTEIEKNIKKIEERICRIDEMLDKDSLEERKQSVLSRIAVDMSEWAKELNLEHSENPYRLDMNKVTVIVDKVDRPVPLKQLGSGSNWVGIHLITYFALHKYFIRLNRPVPNFIFLDQPSQVYFPSELDKKNTDWDMVDTLYNFIFDRVVELNGKLQVIIVDHANLKNDAFRKNVIEDWWDEINLIPEDWYKK